MIKIFKGRSQIIDYAPSATVPNGATLFFTIKKNTSGDTLLSTNAITHDTNKNIGEIKLLNVDTLNLPIGTLLGEVQAKVTDGEDYVVLEAMQIIVSAPLRNE